MVFYRKYRPQTIAELDSESIRKTLYAALSGSKIGNIPHAFLFTGPKGLGKTSTARIVAKIVNCEKESNQQLASSNQKKDRIKNQSEKRDKQDIEPCNECVQCVSITNGSNVDVLEIDAASNRGIDEIRDLREKVRLSPLSARKKVYIIDEVHMLTTEAFNALLKTLEEPPSHVLFILCTTESHKVPQTIVSRCFHVPFRLATDEELVHSFSRIAKNEGFSIDKDAFSLLAQLSEGSFRDGAKILEELAVGNKKITKEIIEETYHVVSMHRNAVDLIEMLAKKDTKQALKLVARLMQEGVDMKYFLEQLLEELHGMLLASVGFAVKKTEKNQQLTLLEIKQLVELLIKANGQLKYAPIVQLPLEMVIIAWGESQKIVAHAPEEKPVTISPAPSVLVPRSKDKNIDTKLTNLWEDLLAKVKVSNHSVAGVLRSCKLQSFDGKTLIIEAAYTFHKERLSEKASMQLLEETVRSITGNKVKISVLLKGI